MKVSAAEKRISELMEERRDLERRLEKVQGADQQENVIRLERELSDATKDLTTYRERVQELESSNPLESECRALEDELEVARRRASELAHQAAESERQLLEQRQRWETELVELKAVLESRQNSFNVARNTVTEATNTDAGPQANPVVDSVIAQFSQLQRDAASRRQNK